MDTMVREGMTGVAILVRGHWPHLLYLKVHGFEKTFACQNINEHVGKLVKYEISRSRKTGKLVLRVLDHDVVLGDCPLCARDEEARRKSYAAREAAEDAENFGRLNRGEPVSLDWKISALARLRQQRNTLERMHFEQAGSQIEMLNKFISRLEKAPAVRL